MTKSLITGGAGFIGSHLVEACLERGHQVIVLDDLSTGKKENLPAGRTGLHFVEGDITDQQILNQIVRTHADIDYVFHLAALVSVPQAMAEPARAHAINFDGTLLLLETFRGRTLKKFVFASSSAVYGDTKTVPVHEAAPTQPISTYGADKLMAEHYLRIYNDSFSLPSIACRFFNVFGERQDPSSPYSGVISIFFDRATACKNGSRDPLIIYGDGQQTRDFIYVKDVVNALVFLAETEAVRGTVFNVGYGQQTTVAELARKIMEIIGADCAVEFHDPRAGDIRFSAADITTLLAAKFEFAYRLESGLRHLRQFLQKKTPFEPCSGGNVSTRHVP
ncbi:MAG: NAD-dependent epimerase/dehydratase family protein [Deltaproteobacteria bacterium]|nr:NAD-dependent epimerase/dehydratase family protein [Deltaproteobacteria bacterium]